MPELYFLKNWPLVVSSPENDVVAERNPDVREPVVGLVVPEEEVNRWDVFDPLLALLQVGLNVLQ